MSKRFGRNQRRKAREALASAENEVAQLAHAVSMGALRFTGAQSELRQLRAKVAVHERQMSACRKVLGDSIALPPVDELVSSERFRDLVERGERVYPPTRLRFDDPLTTNELTSMVKTFEIDTVDAIEGGLELLDDNHLYRHPHAFLTTKQGAILYRVKVESLALIERPEAIARVADMLSREFIDTIQRRFKR